MGPTELSPAFVLHARKYGESHLLLDLLTLSAGRLPVMARGAGSPKSTRRAMLQPFIPLLVAWSGKGRIANLRQAEPQGQYRLPQGPALFSGFYVNELILRLVDVQEPLPELFADYETCMKRLASGTDMEAALRQFELALLRALGYGLDLAHEAHSGVDIRPETFYVYETEQGIRRAGEHDRNLIQGDTLLALAADLPLDDRQRKEARHLMRRVIGYYLGDRPLRSRELFR